MLPDHVADYRSPLTGRPLSIAAVEMVQGNDIREGALRDDSTGNLFPIRRSVPRFVGDGNYADSFGLQWNRYRQVQLDSINGSQLSWERLFNGTGWAPAELKGRRVLEAGCGAGRFSEVLLRCGAELYSFDYSGAVDAALKNLGTAPDWRLCQADIYAMPYPPASFDYVFCFGVLQHTPDPRRAFLQLTRAVKPGGKIAIDVYRRERGISKLAMKYGYRPLTRRLPQRLLLRLLEIYLPWWIHVDRALLRVPLVGEAVASLVPCWNKWSLPISRRHRVEWTILDTFDALAPKFDLPQSEESVRSWFDEAGLESVVIRDGGNGIEAVARRAA